MINGNVRGKRNLELMEWTVRIGTFTSQDLRRGTVREQKRRISAGKKETLKESCLS